VAQSRGNLGRRSRRRLVGAVIGLGTLATATLVMLPAGSVSAASPHVASPHTAATQEAELTAADGAYGDQLGAYSMAVSASTMVVGVPLHATNSQTSEGAAYVFSKTSGSWTQVAELTASDGAQNDWFGGSVAVSGNTIVVGARFHGASHDGATYVFTDTTGPWNQTAELTAADDPQDPNVGSFGNSVAISGSTIVVGAPQRTPDPNDNFVGAVYVFSGSGSTWPQEAELTASNPSLYFGTSVAISGSTIAVGAPFQTVGGHSSQGAAYIFGLAGGSWQQITELTANDGNASDELGTSVAISGSTVVAGSPLHKVGANNYQGAAYLFGIVNTVWQQTAELTANDGAAGDELGKAIAMSGTTIVAGVPPHQVGPNASQGAAYVFTATGGTWAQSAELSANDGAANDLLGKSVAVPDAAIFAGAPEHTVGPNNYQGVAYVFAPAQGLSISSLTLDPAHPTLEDASITATLTIRNDFTTTITNVVPTLTSSDPDGLSIDSGPEPASVASLGAGDTTSFDYTLTPLKAETVNLQPAAAAKDPDGTPVTAPAVPPRVVDLSAGDVTISLVANPTDPVVNHQSTETATIVNKTGSTLTGITALLTGTPADTLTIGSASPASVATLLPHDTTTVSWPISATASKRYDLRADVTLTDPGTGDETDVGLGRLIVGDGAILVTQDGDEAEPASSLTNEVCDVDPATAGNQCTLRAALSLVGALPNVQNIGFDIPGGNVPIIAPQTALPAISVSTTIDGTTQPGGWVVLSGAADTSKDDGFTVTGGGPTIRGFVINGWLKGAGINVTGGDGALVVGDRIGTDPSGTSALPNREGIYAGGNGVTIGGVDGTSTNSCTGDCDLISGNTTRGIQPSPAVSLRVQGDYIGTDVTGESAIGNLNGVGNGFPPDGSAATVMVGGPSVAPGRAPGNLISGNSESGVQLGDIAAVVVAGNLIGLDETGTTSLQPPVPDGQDTTFHAGVYVGKDASVTVGGSSKAAGNVISGWVTGVDEYANSQVSPVTVVRNDRVGTDLSGTHAVPNQIGIDAPETVSDSQISGNQVGIAHVGTVTGSLIGTTADGLSALPNGLGINAGAQIGGLRPAGSTSCEDPCNVISGNHDNGILRSHTVQGNFIGTDITGEAALPNNTDGGTGWAATGVLLGGKSNAAGTGVCDLACNLISGNSAAGAGTLVGAGTDPHVQGNVIGLSASGAALGNQGPGVVAEDDTLIGGAGDLGNRIWDNTGPAVSDTAHGVALVEGNSMSGNADGITIDAGDATRAPKAPGSVAAVFVGTQSMIVTGHVFDTGSAAGNTARLDVYASATCSGKPQGLRPLGSTEIGLLSGGDFSFSADPAAVSLLNFITVTSTEDGHTGPFSECAEIPHFQSVTPRPGQKDATRVPGFTPNETVNVTLHSTPVHLGTVKADSSGIANATVTIPRDAPAGAHHLIFTGAKSGHVVSIPITVTPKPQAGLLHLVAPKSLFAKKVRGSSRVPIAGHAGVPRHGARHALVLIQSEANATVDKLAVKAHAGRLVVLPVTDARIVVSKRATIRLTVLGWYAAKASSIGDVYRRIKPSTLKKSGALNAGTHHLPFLPALDGVVLTVRSLKAGTKIGGVIVRASSKPTVLVVRATAGVVAVHLAKGATATVTGWYGAPNAAPGGSSTG
jgi:hypothetical protein